MKDLTDAELLALTAQERRVVRIMAQGGHDNPRIAAAVFDRVRELTGLPILSEQVRGEPRAYYPPNNEAVDRAWSALADRIRGLPRLPDGAVYLSETDGGSGGLDGWWVPTDNPDWWRMAASCTETCHHPVHAFNPERRPHIVPSEEVVR